MIPKASPPSRLKMNFTPTKPSSSTSPWPMTLYAMFLNRRLIVPPSPGSASGQLGRADVRIPRQHQSRDEDSDRVAWAGYEHPEVAHPPWWLALDAGYEGPVLGGDEVGHQRGVRTRERAQVAEVPVGLARLESLDLREVWWWAVAVVQALDVLALIGHDRRRSRPSVVVDVRAGVGADQAPQPVALLDLEAGRVAHRDDAFAKLDRPHLAPVPAAPVVLDGRVRTVEVPIKKGKALRALVEVILEAAADGADLRLMQELIGLQVYGPVAGAPGESDVGLLRPHHATFALG